MAKKRYTAEQIIGHLRQAEVMVGQGRSMEKVLRSICARSAAELSSWPLIILSVV